MSNRATRGILAALIIGLAAQQANIYFISKRLDVLAESIDLLATRQKLNLPERKTQYGQWQ